MGRTLVLLSVGILFGCSSDTGDTEETSATTAIDSADGQDAEDGTSGSDGASGNDGTSGGDDCAKLAPAGAPCNPYCQTGCDDSQACTVAGASFACASPGTLSIGSECSDTECAPGLACFGVQEDGGAQKCRQFCIDDSECPDGRRCTLSVNFPGGASATFCGDIEVGCDVFESPTTCPSGQACYLINGVTKCAEAGALALGESCSNQGPGACTAGLQCLLECTEVCSTTGASSPSCSEVCSEFQTVSQANGIGFCLNDTPPKECDLFEQTGCDEGEACFPAIEGWKCLSTSGVALGEPCEFTNDCVAGGACIGNQCQQLCSTREDAPDAVSCTDICETFNGLNPTAWGMGFCTDAEPAVPCDFWAQDCQEAGSACYFVNNGATCLTTEVDGQEGAACGSLTECGGGLMCVNNICAQVCSIDEFAPPPAPICVDVCPNGSFSPYGSFDNQVGVCAESP